MNQVRTCISVGILHAAKVRHGYTSYFFGHCQLNLMIRSQIISRTSCRRLANHLTWLVLVRFLLNNLNQFLRNIIVCFQIFNYGRFCLTDIIFHYKGLGSLGNNQVNLAAFASLTIGLWISFNDFTRFDIVAVFFLFVSDNQLLSFDSGASLCHSLTRNIWHASIRRAIIKKDNKSRQNQ